MVITVVGLGFVGLTAALGFAAKGHQVYGIEKDADRRKRLQSGHLPFYEPGMQEQLERLLNQHLWIQENQEYSAGLSDCVFYCVGTPFAEDGSADLTYLVEAIEETLPLLVKERHTVLVVKSTVPMGTLRDRIMPMVMEKGYVPGEDLELANNPEFLREGKSWEDFMNADRIVIGSFTEEGFDRVAEVYQEFQTPIFHVNPTTAEYIKYLSNTLLATMISYSNEMANAAYQVGGIEISQAFQIIHKDRRWEQNIMSSYVYPGCGYGGYCLPKDSQAMLFAGQAAGADMPVLEAVIQTNRKMPETICDRLMEDLDEECTVGILGLSFKPFTDDVRDTPAAKVIECLRKRGVTRILGYDPIADQEFLRHYPALEVQCPGSLEQMKEQCDRLAILTAWPEFKPLLEEKKVLDFRYMR